MVFFVFEHFCWQHDHLEKLTLSCLIGKLLYSQNRQFILDIPRVTQRRNRHPFMYCTEVKTPEQAMGNLGEALLLTGERGRGILARKFGILLVFTREKIVVPFDSDR